MTQCVGLVLTLGTQPSGEPSALFLWDAAREQFVRVAAGALFNAPDLAEVANHVAYGHLSPVPGEAIAQKANHFPVLCVSGKTLYAANCAACRGALGEGDGPAGSGLSPPPANLPALVHSPLGRDDYLMWAISAGGAEYGTAMPAFKNPLAEDARWKIIRSLRTL